MEELTGRILRVRTYKRGKESLEHQYEIPSVYLPLNKKDEATVEMDEDNLKTLNYLSNLMNEITDYHKKISKNTNQSDINIETKIQI